MAIMNKEVALIYAALNGDIECLRALLDAKASVDAKNKWGTALIWAVINGHIECVRALLENGADVNTKNKEGKTALMLAVENKHTDIANILSEHQSLRKKICKDISPDVVSKGQNNKVTIAVNAKSKVPTLQIIIGKEQISYSKQGLTRLPQKTIENLVLYAIRNNNLEALRLLHNTCQKQQPRLP